MPPAYLLDTNAVSALIRGRTPALLTRLAAEPVGTVGISSITEAELRYGLARKPDALALRHAVERFLLMTPAAPWDSAAASVHGLLRAELEAAGTPLGGMDCLIAAHALALGAVLVSGDRAFRQVPRLRLEDWAVPD